MTYSPKNKSTKQLFPARSAYMNQNTHTDKKLISNDKLKQSFNNTAKNLND